MLEKMRCIAGSTRFENGKIRDVLFLGMPKLETERHTQPLLANAWNKGDVFLPGDAAQSRRKDGNAKPGRYAERRMQKAFQDFAISGIARRLIGKLHSASSWERWQIGHPARIGHLYF